MGTNRLFHHFGESTFADTSCRRPETALISIYCLPEGLAILWKVESRWLALLPRLSPQPHYVFLLFQGNRGKESILLKMNRNGILMHLTGAYDLFILKKITSNLDQITTVGRCSKSVSKAEGSVGLPESNCTGEHEIVNPKFYIVISLFFWG